MILYALDTTAQRQLEQQVAQAQKMNAVGQLAGGIAHDFNNLLTVIRGNASLLDMNTGLPVEDRISVQEVQDACTRAAILTQQLLAFSRKQRLTLEVVNLNDLIRALTKMLQRLLGADEATLQRWDEQGTIQQAPGTTP